jgi:hypothetical protein
MPSELMSAPKGVGPGAVGREGQLQPTFNITLNLAEAAPGGGITQAGSISASRGAAISTGHGHAAAAGGSAAAAGGPQTSARVSVGRRSGGLFVGAAFVFLTILGILIGLGVEGALTWAEVGIAAGIVAAVMAAIQLVR